MRNKNGGKTSSTVKERYNQKTYDRIVFRVKKEESPTKEEIEKEAQKNGKSLNGYITDAIRQQIAGRAFGDIPDLEAYARSAGMTVDDYIRAAIKEKMDRQDKEYTEEIVHEAIY